MRKRAAVCLLALGALLLTPGAAGVPDVPGDPTPPVVTPVIYRNARPQRLVHDERHGQLVGDDPESIILSTTGCNAVTFEQHDWDDAHVLGGE